MTPEQETKTRILATAFDLFSSKGYDRVSLTEIIQIAGISKGGLFHHFDSKYALGRDSLMWWVQNHMELDLTGEVAENMDEKEILIHFIEFMVDFMKADTMFTKFFWSIFDEALRKKEDMDIWMEFLNGYVDMIESVYEKMGVKDPYMKALVFLSNMDGIALYYSMLKDLGTEIDLTALKEELIRTYVTFDEEVKE